METHDEATFRLIKVGPLGPFDNNAYIIVDPAAGEAAIVDMPAEGEKVLEATAGLRVTKILLTHTHRDHWFSYDLLKGATGAPILCHPAEVQMPVERIDVPLTDGQALTVGNVAVRAIHTPGHTPGSVCLQVGRYLIAGDTLFPGGPGHSDTPDDLQQSIRSIVQRLYVLPDETLVLPGHGDGTTIGASRREYAVFASRVHPPDLCGDVLWETV
ncbi:MAG TPA: MBL fold metallo-hydrolase [Dehalococcoidia bacterium]|nr:MBL fold metallo-hydrolase [Dehalococcoidia bacterium]